MTCRLQRLSVSPWRLPCHIVDLVKLVARRMVSHGWLGMAPALLLNGLLGGWLVHIVNALGGFHLDLFKDGVIRRCWAGPLRMGRVKSGQRLVAYGARVLVEGFLQD